MRLDYRLKTCRGWLAAVALLAGAGASFSAPPSKSREFWSFQPVQNPPVPEVKDSSWTQTPIDHFIMARLEQQGLQPNPDAGKRALIRRATFDLTGLPPSPSEVDAFLADSSRDAFQKVIDRLLASPAYGERWGRHWLDLVRYADTSGCNADVPIPDAYKYRNYVIKAFSSDKPYDQFLREQIAGDLLPSSSESERCEKIIATGYLAISRRFSSLAEEPHLTFDDTIDNVGKTMLGLTLGCARCHDHKYDPLPTADYYALYGIFSSSRYAFPGTEIPRHSRNLVALVPSDRYEKEVRSHEEKMAAIDLDMDAHYARKVSLDTGKERNAADADHKKAVEQRDALIKSGPGYERAYAVTEGVSANTHGLGTENQNLPSFVVLAPYLPYAGTQSWDADFLPAIHQGTRVVPGEEPVRDLKRRSPTVEIQEADPTLKLYGLERGAAKGFAWQCLVARRMAERGVRFIELIDSGSTNNWDSHGKMAEHIPKAKNVDQAIAGLLMDLKSRGMLDDTLVVFTTEFGRTPHTDGPTGRSHHPYVFSSWLAGGGVKGGIVYGESDDYGYDVAKDLVHAHDFHATILHRLGLNHEKLTYRYAGRDFRLTDVQGSVVRALLA